MLESIYQNLQHVCTIFLIIYLICEKNLLTQKINYPDIKGMKTLDHLTSPVNKLLVPKIILMHV